MNNLKTRFFGLDLKNPLIASSSSITENVDHLKELEINGVSAIVLKSVFEEEIIHSLEQNMNSMVASGFVYPETYDYFEYDEMNDPMGNYLKLISDAKKAVQVPVIASVNCVSSEKWPFYAKQLQTAGADAIELNVFMLPSDLNRTEKETELIYFDIVNQVLKQVSIPVTLKIGSYSGNLASLIQKLSKTDVAGITLFNRSYSPDFDIENLTLTSANVLSSQAELSLPLRWISIMSGRVDCDLAASTGVHSGTDLVKVLLAGANAAQVASTIYKNGFEYLSVMLRDLEDWMIKNLFQSIEDFKGKLRQLDSINPAEDERIQFIKHFRNKAFE